MAYSNVFALMGFDGSLLVWEQQFIPAGEPSQFVEDLDGLPGQRHDMLGAHLHARRRYAPFSAGKVKLIPARPA